MPEGPLGFPRVTDFGPFTTSNKHTISDERIKKSVSRLDTEFDIVDRKNNNPYPKWDREDTRQSGVTGLWIRNQDVMVIEPRGGPLQKTHRTLLDELYLKSQNSDKTIEYIPWSSVKTRSSISADEGWFADLNATAGSILSNNNSMRAEARPYDVWPMIYTLWMTNHPHSTVTTYKYGDNETSFKLANAYEHLAFALGGLPEPKINRVK